MVESSADYLTKLAPDKDTKVSSITNGVLNGITIASAPFLALTAFGKGFSKTAFWIAEATGALVGGWLGNRESERVRIYREAVVEEVDDINKRLINLEAGHLHEAGQTKPAASNTSKPTASDALPKINTTEQEPKPVDPSEPKSWSERAQESRKLAAENAQSL